MSDESNSVWFFTNTQNEAQAIKVMGLESARAFVSVLPPADLEFWTVHQSGTFAAEPLHTCIALKNGAAAPTFATEIGVIGLAKEESSGYDKRVFKRIDARLRVLVFSGAKLFSACSRNISRGGLLLEEAVPLDFVQQTCRVLICLADNSMNVEFEAKILEASERGTRVMFQGQTAEYNIEKLLAWLEKNGAPSGPADILSSAVKK